MNLEYILVLKEDQNLVTLKDLQFGHIFKAHKILPKK